MVDTGSQTAHCVQPPVNQRVRRLVLHPYCIGPPRPTGRLRCLASRKLPDKAALYAAHTMQAYELILLLEQLTTSWL